MVTPEACLSPAVCYHVYHMNRDRTASLPTALAYGICGKCFRYESSNIAGLRRLWDFTMREVVFLGDREGVLAHRERSIEMMGRFLDEHRLAGEIRTASDPFFIAPDAVAKTYFQLSSETKYEIALMLPGDDRLAVGSHNYHTDFFGRAFNIELVDEGAAAQRLRRLRAGAVGPRVPRPARPRPLAMAGGDQENWGRRYTAHRLLRTGGIARSPRSAPPSWHSPRSVRRETPFRSRSGWDLPNPLTRNTSAACCAARAHARLRTPESSAGGYPSLRPSTETPNAYSFNSCARPSRSASQT